MPRTRTVHTPEPDSSQIGKIQFHSVKLAEFGRVDTASGWMKFQCPMSAKSMDVLFPHMGWDIPGDKSSLEKLDGKLKGGHFILTAKADDEKLKVKSQDGSVNLEMEIDIEFGEITDFQCVRLELEGRKKKGFRRELRFKATFAEKCEDAAANLEAYMMRSGNSRGTLKVTYFVDPEQITMSHDESQSSLVPDDVTATGEQAAAVAELGGNTLASARQAGEKRSRLSDAN